MAKIDRNNLSMENSAELMSHMISIMIIRGATNDEIERAVKYSAAILDKAKHQKECHSLFVELDISELMSKYIFSALMEVG